MRESDVWIVRAESYLATMCKKLAAVADGMQS
jgi:hypothetical protein